MWITIDWGVWLPEVGVSSPPSLGARPRGATGGDQAPIDERLLIAGAFVLYLVFVPIARTTVFSPELHVAVFWFPVAAFVALIARLPVRWVPAAACTLAVAEFVGTQVFEGVPLGSTPLWVVATTSEALLLGLALKAVGATELRRPVELVGFTAAAILVVLLTATVGGLAVSRSFGGPWVDNFFAWWLGDVSGILIAAPIFLAFRRPSTIRWARVFEYLGTAVVAIVVAIWIFLTEIQLDRVPFKVAVLVPLLAWIAIRFGISAAGAVAAVTVTIGAIAATQNVGLFQGTDQNAQLLFSTQVFLVLTCLSAYAVGTIAEAYRTAQMNLAAELSEDWLTGLINRRAMLDHINAPPVGNSRQAWETRAVLFCDLRGFKQINDILGHAAGDDALVEAGRRIKSAVGDAGLVARFGGDEFVVLIPSADAPSVVDRLANAITAQLSEPMPISDALHTLGIDIGVALQTWPTTDPEGVVLRADVALLEAKSRPDPTVEFYSEALERKMTNRLATEALIRQAIEDDAIEAWFQPVIESSSFAVVGAEALARIRTADGVIHGPGEFIKVAEASGLIVSLGRVMLRQALDWLKHHSGGEPKCQVAVNLAVLQLLDVDFVGFVRQELADRDIAPHRLILEVTERALLDPESRAVSVLEELDALGVRLSIDDFGTGYASLSALRLIPADIIKVDRSFVGGMVDNPHDRAIVEAIIRISHDLGRVVVAEGVETAAQLELVRELGAEYIQGYHFGRPAPASHFDFPGIPAPRDRSPTISQEPSGNSGGACRCGSVGLGVSLCPVHGADYRLEA
ncbi:MAG: putative bifunctional diguanylate cyclase/phosphodiesterase [Candidatus Nanopelagicales bacterium]